MIQLNPKISICNFKQKNNWNVNKKIGDKGNIKWRYTLQSWSSNSICVYTSHDAQAYL